MVCRVPARSEFRAVGPVALRAQAVRISAVSSRLIAPQSLSYARRLNMKKAGP
jgi:hypothetical protein